MQLKSFIIPVLSPERNEGDVNSFLRSHRVLRIERHLVNDDTGAVQFAKSDVESIGLLKFDFLGLRTLTVLQDVKELVRNNYGRDNNKDDFNLSSEEQERYEHYRKVRNEVSMKKGVPPYVIFTNQELAILARIPDLADVHEKKIDGIAPSRLSANISFFLEGVSDEESKEPDGADSAS